jgi:hypothetical protein
VGSAENSSESAQNLPVAVIDKRTAANRRNALKSTGPRTKKGKSAVATNSSAHGIYASYLVIRPIESPQEWNGYLAAKMDSMMPSGMLETTLAERVIVNSWRLRRAIRYESEQALVVQEGANEVRRVPLPPWIDDLRTGEDQRAANLALDGNERAEGSPCVAEEIPGRDMVRAKRIRAERRRASPAAGVGCGVDRRVHCGRLTDEKNASQGREDRKE